MQGGQLGQANWGGVDYLGGHWWWREAREEEGCYRWWLGVEWIVVGVMKEVEWWLL